MVSSLALKPADSKNDLAPRSPGRAGPSTPAHPWSANQASDRSRRSRPTPTRPCLLLDEAGTQPTPPHAPPVCRIGGDGKTHDDLVERADQDQGVGPIQQRCEAIAEGRSPGRHRVPSATRSPPPRCAVTDSTSSSASAASRRPSSIVARRTDSTWSPPARSSPDPGSGPFVEQLIHPAEDGPTTAGGRLVGPYRDQLGAVQTVQPLDHLGGGQGIESRDGQGGDGRDVAVTGRVDRTGTLAPAPVLGRLATGPAQLGTTPRTAAAPGPTAEAAEEDARPGRLTLGPERSPRGRVPGRGNQPSDRRTNSSCPAFTANWPTARAEDTRTPSRSRPRAASRGNSSTTERARPAGT